VPTHATIYVGPQEVPVAEIGWQGVLSTTREIADARLILRTQLKTDATESIVSTLAGSPTPMRLSSRS